MGLLHIFRLLLFFRAIAFGSQVCSSNRDVMVTDAFVDLYVTDSVVIPLQPVLATSDGGAVYGSIRAGGGGPRIVKVDSNANFEWLQGSCAAEDSSAVYRYYAREIVEEVAVSDSTLYYIYVAGYVTTATDHSTPVWGFMMKYSRWDGSLLSSAIMKKSDASCIYTLMLDSKGNMFFGGYSYVSGTGTYSAWLARVTDKSTLSISEQVLSSGLATPTRVFRVLEDTSASTYVLAGGLDTAAYLWVSGFISSTWTLSWEHKLPACVLPIVYTILKISTDTYAILASQVFYTTTKSGGISSGVSLPDSYSMTTSPTDPAMLMIFGCDSTPSSFAYYYDPVSNTKYTSGLTAHYSGIEFYSTSFNPSYPRVWVSGYFPYGSNGNNKISIFKLECVTPFSCISPALNYRNRACYAPSTTGCFGLCATCLIPGNINGCETVTSIAIQAAASIFAGRCPYTGTYYQASSSSCTTVTSTSSSCHVLCGMECFVSSDPTQCAQHCKGAQLEPYIDDSELYLNTCKCKGSRTVSTVSSRCVFTSGCYPLCANSECGELSDNTKCISCISGSHIVSVTIRPWTTCACADGYALSGTSCLSCHPLCEGCTAPGDNTQCTACASLPNVDGISTTCSCAPPTVYDSGLCVFTTGCNPLCAGECTVRGDAGACAFSCVQTAVTTWTGTTGVYACACPASTLFNGIVCAQVANSNCQPLCEGGCLEDHSYECVACKDQINVVARLVSGANYYTCTCASGTELVGTVCAYQTNCSSYCNGTCLVQNDSSACLGCAAGIIPGEATTGDLGVTCACPADTVYTGLTCTTVISANCSWMCGTGNCTTANDPLTCIGSCSDKSNVAVKSSASDIVSCGCANGTHLSSSRSECVLNITCDSLCESCLDSDTCLECPTGEGMVLSSGKCICATSQGYLMITDQVTGVSSCIQSSTGTSSAIKYSG